MPDPLKIDLDAAAAARAAQREEIGAVPTFVFKGKEFKLPPEMPVEFSLFQADAHDAEQAAKAAEAAGDKAAQKDANGRANKATVEVMRALVGEQFDGFIALHPTMGDMKELITRLMEWYGTTAGESSASATPSATTGPRSRQTSKRTTG